MLRPLGFTCVAVATSAAVADLIRHAEAEAAALIRENLDIVNGLVEALAGARHP
jgi:hypothetical protein